MEFAAGAIYHWRQQYLNGHPANAAFMNEVFTLYDSLLRASDLHSFLEREELDRKTYLTSIRLLLENTDQSIAKILKGELLDTSRAAEPDVAKKEKNKEENR